MHTHTHLQARASESPAEQGRWRGARRSGSFGCQRRLDDEHWSAVASAARVGLVVHHRRHRRRRSNDGPPRRSRCRRVKPESGLEHGRRPLARVRRRVPEKKRVAMSLDALPPGRHRVKPLPLAALDFGWELHRGAPRRAVSEVASIVHFPPWGHAFSGRCSRGCGDRFGRIGLLYGLGALGGTHPRCQKKRTAAAFSLSTSNVLSPRAAMSACTVEGSANGPAPVVAKNALAASRLRSISASSAALRARFASRSAKSPIPRRRRQCLE